MGCYESKMEKEETITRCKDRNYFIKQSVSSRNALATTLSSYATNLKNAGAALTDFAQTDLQNDFNSPSSAVPQLSYGVPLPPPPLPAALRRAITMPNDVQSSRIEVEDEESGLEIDEDEEGGLNKESRKSESVNLVQVLSEVDNRFLMASEAVREVSKVLHAACLHSRSILDDTTGHLDYSARVMRVVTWDRSFRETPNIDERKDDFDSEEHETLATVLAKLLAWERKLYTQVKAAELTKLEYQKKIGTLNKLKKRGTNSEAVEIAKANLSHLQSNYTVEMELLESTVSEINQLRDQQLYPKLVQLVDGMATMWADMQIHHEQQFCIVTLLRSVDSQFPTETTEHHHDRTYQLLVVVQEWQSQFEKLINNQKGYIKSLYTWLKLNLISIESDNTKENTTSPQLLKTPPPLQILLKAWNDHIEKLPSEVAETALAIFTAIVETTFQQQQEELVLKRKCEEIRKELTRKSRRFEQWEVKYKQRKGLLNELGDNDPDEVIREKRVLVELEKRLEEEKHAYERQCIQVRKKSFRFLQIHLPELFKAMADFCLECCKMYRGLRSISHRLSSGQSSS